MKHKQRFYPESRIAGFSNIDGTLAFYNQVNALLHPDDTVLDVGCGRGAYGDDPIPYRRQRRILKGKVARVIGIDVDPAGNSNPYIDEFRPITGARWPIDNGSIDLCLADNVLEHVEDPPTFFAECQRVVKTGGWACIRTPNIRSYFGLAARLTPKNKQLTVLDKAKERLNPADTFPTLYRCNTLGCVRRMLASHGFEPVVYGYESEPGYLSFSGLFYFLGVLYQRLVPERFKVGIHAFGKRMPEA